MAHRHENKAERGNRMALKVLMLRKKLTDKQAELESLRVAASGFEIREKEIEAAIGEATTQEEQETVETSITELELEKAGNKEKQRNLIQEITDIESEIAEIEEKNKPTATPVARKETDKMETRAKFFDMDMEQRDAFFANEEVKGFLQRARGLMQEKRTVSGSELLIPTVMLEVIRENIAKYSKLISKVNLRTVAGKARQNIMGTIPEAVWTEMCAKLNEIDLTFNQVEVDGYKVGGYIAICNATLEDSDIALASEIISALGQAIGYALDKAILFGTGTKMPLGIVTRLAQTEAPSDYPANARDWADLHTSNVLTIATASATGVKLFQSIVKNSGAAKGKYSRGGKFWAMSDATYTTLMAEAMSINAAGAITSGQLGTMPVVGGEIVILDFIPDNTIIGGYGDLYLLAERAGTALSQSEHVRFLEDQTVFKGTARYDGMPVIPEGFVVMGIGAAPATNITFADDATNTLAEN